MSEVILDDIPFGPDLGQLRDALHVEENSRDAEELEALAAEARGIARPKAIYRVAFVESKDHDSIVVDGTTLTSRVLRVNLDKDHRVFPYLATCGTELDEWSCAIQDVMHRYWADTIKELALKTAGDALSADIEQRYRPGRTSSMSPGTVEDWPITQQRPLFAILGDPKATIGVRLSDSFLMIPTKSVSGIRFATEEGFESCQLCPREDCPGRRAPYDEHLYARRYRPPGA